MSKETPIKVDEVQNIKPNVKPYNFYMGPPEPINVFSSGIEIISTCPSAKSVVLEISRSVADKLEYLQAQFQDVEFLVYGNAEKLGNTNEYILKDIIIPKQTVQVASVKEVEQKGSFNTVIHKHPGNNPGGFSQTDIEYVNSNHTFSLIIGSKSIENIISSCRMPTDCQKYIMCPIQVHIAPRLYVDDDKFRNSVSNIKTETGFFNTINNLIFGK